MCAYILNPLIALYECSSACLNSAEILHFFQRTSPLKTLVVVVVVVALSSLDTDDDDDAHPHHHHLFFFVFIIIDEDEEEKETQDGEKCNNPFRSQRLFSPKTTRTTGNEKTTTRRRPERFRRHDATTTTFTAAFHPKSYGCSPRRPPGESRGKCARRNRRALDRSVRGVAEKRANCDGEETVARRVARRRGE